MRDFTDRLLNRAKPEKGLYDAMSDPRNYTSFNAIYHQVVDLLDSDELTKTMWLDMNKEQAHGIARFVVAQTLIVLAEKNLLIRAKTDRAARETYEQNKDVLIWEEIQKLLSFEVQICQLPK